MIGIAWMLFGIAINSKGHAAAVLGLEPTTLRSRMQM
jgi:hypothetical protein